MAFWSGEINWADNGEIAPISVHFKTFKPKRVTFSPNIYVQAPYGTGEDNVYRFGNKKVPQLRTDGENVFDEFEDQNDIQYWKSRNYGIDYQGDVDRYRSLGYYAPTSHGGLYCQLMHVEIVGLQKFLDGGATGEWVCTSFPFRSRHSYFIAVSMKYEWAYQPYKKILRSLGVSPIFMAPYQDNVRGIHSFASGQANDIFGRKSWMPSIGDHGGAFRFQLSQASSLSSGQVVAPGHGYGSGFHLMIDNYSGSKGGSGYGTLNQAFSADLSTNRKAKSLIVHIFQVKRL